MGNEPGKVFNYNSGATLILGHIFRLATGTDIEEYAVEHLFTPLGIDDYYWDRHLRSDRYAGRLIYLRAEPRQDCATLCKKGRWRNEQVIPATWVEESMAPGYPDWQVG